MTTPSPDEYTLLCERCGYVIEGLPTSAPCPECATPIESSLPEFTRLGTPYQLNPSSAALFATARAMLLRPRKTLRSMQIGSKHDIPLEDRFSFTALAAASLILLLALVAHTIAGCIAHPESWPDALRDLFIAFLFWLVGATILCPIGLILLTLLCTIESVGIRTYGRVHNRRITPAVARSICAHASIGWLTGAILATLPILVIAATVYHTDAFHFMSLLVPLGLFLGLLHFEILIYLGVRACPYANRQRPPFIPSPQPPRGTATPPPPAPAHTPSTAP